MPLPDSSFSLPPFFLPPPFKHLLSLAVFSIPICFGCGGCCCCCASFPALPSSLSASSLYQLHWQATRSLLCFSSIVLGY